MYTLPIKQPQHILQSDKERYQERFSLMPGRTLSSWNLLRHRTKLDHPCWFSKSSYKQSLSVRECIINYPGYMLWIYEHLNINWSIHVIQVLEELSNSHKPRVVLPQL